MAEFAKRRRATMSYHTEESTIWHYRGDVSTIAPARPLKRTAPRRQRPLFEIASGSSRLFQRILQKRPARSGRRGLGGYRFAAAGRISQIMRQQPVAGMLQVSSVPLHSHHLTNRDMAAVEMVFAGT